MFILWIVFEHCAIIVHRVNLLEVLPHRFIHEQVCKQRKFCVSPVPIVLVVMPIDEQKVDPRRQWVMWD